MTASALAAESSTPRSMNQEPATSALRGFHGPLLGQVPEVPGNSRSRSNGRGRALMESPMPLSQLLLASARSLRSEDLISWPLRSAMLL